MTVEPPGSGRPTGPPSGPLSGRPSQPPPGPPSRPSGGGGGTPEEPRRPWWSSVPRMALLAAAVAAVVVAAVLLTTSGGGSGARGEVFLQPAAQTGPDPFTGSTATASSAPPPSAVPTAPSQPPNAVRGVQGGAPGLYGGTRNVSSCDVERQIRELQAQPARNRAFASVAGVPPAGVPAYLRGLTPVQLRLDTRVTNHGYHNGSVTSYQAVLQAGTAVLVDDRGVPRVRCACGNPLTPPVAQSGPTRYTGQRWPGYRPQDVVVVTPAPAAVREFVVRDVHHGDWFARRAGDTGGRDRPAPAPPTPWPFPTATTLTPSGSPSASPSGSGTGGSTPPSSAPASSPGSSPPSSAVPPGSSAPPSSPPAPPSSATGSQPPPSSGPASPPSQPAGSQSQPSVPPQSAPQAPPSVTVS
ncbi:DUF6777 domain-containing protein [Streptomyces tropicalis]|uniref:DUF6777 domain-containing protein n=1 Tax=Streptomyces tropicalis TaxID=3034234 RepID=A0ABT6AA33_9ACTN|nr:DUF6777 domain-containing protein [Streptomyces tropicalis]MDF3301297.1 hypothetical protein [Streptomyces tropicalis]